MPLLLGPLTWRLTAIRPIQLKRFLQATTMAAIDAAARLDRDQLSLDMSDFKSLCVNARRYRELKGKKITRPLDRAV
jgi:hypothetical protein